jgi:hypothetical protein
MPMTMVVRAPKASREKYAPSRKNPAWLNISNAAPSGFIRSWQRMQAGLPSSVAAVTRSRAVTPAAVGAKRASAVTSSRPPTSSQRRFSRIQRPRCTSDASSSKLPPCAVSHAGCVRTPARSVAGRVTQRASWVSATSVPRPKTRLTSEVPNSAQNPIAV